MLQMSYVMKSLSRILKWVQELAQVVISCGIQTMTTSITISWKCKLSSVQTLKLLIWNNTMVQLESKKNWEDNKPKEEELSNIKDQVTTI
jgi:hypothetical protein